MNDEVKKERIAKRLASAGVCSRRDAERMIGEGRVRVNGEILTTPAFTVSAADKVEVDGAVIGGKPETRLWLYHKPAGFVTSHRDERGRETIFDLLPKKMPRVISIGRLDLNSEGLLLLTNDGELSRHLELPATGWTRKYRVRAFGRITQEELDGLQDGITIDGMHYGEIQARVEKQQGSNVWLEIILREGKNREIRRVLEHLGLEVNRLIRKSYGPFHLGQLERNGVEEVPENVIKSAVGKFIKI